MLVPIISFVIGHQLGRALCGFGAGFSIASYTHVARVSAKSARPIRISGLRWVETFGRIMAPSNGFVIVAVFVIVISKYLRLMINVNEHVSSITSTGCDHG